MLKFMQTADVVIMGKSLAGHDEGHNLIEPALLAKPIVTGTTLRNFRFILRVLEEQNALFSCRDEELFGTLEKLIASPELRDEFGKRAFDTIDVHRGAADKTIDCLALG
jgi:3-deoxy-D-manno-octulosonic-acid transferase